MRQILHPLFDASLGYVVHHAVDETSLNQQRAGDQDKATDKSAIYAASIVAAAAEFKPVCALF